MLDTVIKIGKLYRQAPNAHIYHEQVNSVMKDVEALRKNKDKDEKPIETTFYEVPVIDKGDSFLFDLDNLRIIEDEDKQKHLKRMQKSVTYLEIFVIVTSLIGKEIYKNLETIACLGNGKNVHLLMEPKR
jgi:hypothetical protein